MIPEVSRRQVDKAGDILISPHGRRSAIELNEAFTIINNWRSSHSFPLNTFQMQLRRRANEIDQKCLVAQRIKRIFSIHLKLQRFKWLKLSEMQDIGGCRAVVQNVVQVDRLVDLYKRSKIRHKLAREDDYIRKPKESGYRGIHPIYHYHSEKNDTYNGHKVEIQIRSRSQHAWATAVEIVGAFIREALKASQGREEWLRFFALMGAWIASREKLPTVPGTPKGGALKKEIQNYTSILNVDYYFHACRAALSPPKSVDIQDAHL